MSFSWPKLFLRGALSKLCLVAACLAGTPFAQAKAPDNRPFADCNSAFELLNAFSVDARGFEKLNIAFEAQVSRLAHSLSSKKRQKFFDWARIGELWHTENIVQGDGHVFIQFGGVGPDFDFYGFPMAKRFELWKPMIHHPLGLIVAVHELVHIRQNIKGGWLKSYQSKMDILSKERQAGRFVKFASKVLNMKDEIEAFRAEYSLIKSSFALTDLPSLRTEYPFDGLAELEKRFVGKDGKFEPLKAYNSTPEKYAVYQEYLKKKTNSKFIQMVEEVLNHSEGEYLKLRKQPYRYKFR